MSESTVVVAMSGGVDSSVAAALLKRQGYQVIGMMLRLWSEPGKESSNRCCTPDAMLSARMVAHRLGIPFYVKDVKEKFQQVVVNYFIEGYERGITPNPCLLCNQEIRWGFLLDCARSAGADYFATGHYARLQRFSDGQVGLFKGIDSAKDQSYVLHRLSQKQLSQTILPLGELTKPQVRQMALELKMPVASRRDSQDLCFLAGEDYRQFLSRHSDRIDQPGEIYSKDGTRLGLHSGLANYTIGQRKGLEFGDSKPHYVIQKDVTTNRLFVGDVEDTHRRNLIVKEVNWLVSDRRVQPFEAQVKIRYRAREAPALVKPLEGNKVEVIFEESQRDVTPGQAAVFYEGDRCLGGGIIESD